MICAMNPPPPANGLKKWQGALSANQCDNKVQTYFIQIVFVAPTSQGYETHDQCKCP